MDDTAVAPTVRTGLRAMGGRGSLVLVGGPDGLADHLAERLGELEARWSRFRPSSDVSRLHSAEGRAVSVHPDTIHLLRAMHEGWRTTGGRYDPTVLASVVALGGHRSRDGHGLTRLPPSCRPGPAPGLDGLEIDEVSGTVRLPVGVAVEPGGIGKGLAADLLVEEALALGAEGALVELGGDLRGAGRSPAGDGWSVAVDPPVDGPDAPAELGRLTLEEAGVATSTPDNRPLHDDRGRLCASVVEPTTGRPALTELRSATVVAGTAWFAEVLATAALVAGTTAGAARLVENHGATALLVDVHDDLRVVTPRSPERNPRV